MESITKTNRIADEEEAKLEMWKFVLGFTPIAIVKCAIELNIADVLETAEGGAMSLTDLSTALRCSPPLIYRIMRYLIHHGFFNLQQMEVPTGDQPCYVHTPLSRLLIKTGPNSMASLLLLANSHVMLAPWHNLSRRCTLTPDSAFSSANGEDLWNYVASDPVHSQLFNDGLACRAKNDMLAIIDQYPEAFRGIGSLVDVGGGNGTALATLVKACPWIRGINFDLLHVTSVAPCFEGIEHVSGDMFVSVPKADAAFLMHVLHDWNDEECIKVLRNCREAVPKDGGKVIIAEVVVGEGDLKFNDVRLALDMVVLAHTETGKQRTLKEWGHVLKSSGFSTHTVKHIQSIVAVIEAYP